MNPSAVIPLITALGSVVGMVVAGWAMLAHFDKRNTDRFDALQRQIEATQTALQRQIDGVKEVLRAEMKEMRAEIRLEIREASDRRIAVK